MKPLLILAPSAARWPSVSALLAESDAGQLADVQRRLEQGLADAQDAFAGWPDGGKLLAGGLLRRCGEIAVLSHVFTRPEHRRRGYCRGVLQTLLSWFDMTGGKWLYLGTPAELAEGLFVNFGFRKLHAGTLDGRPYCTMLRALGTAPGTPLDRLDERTTVRELTRADFPQLVALMQHRPGADPRASLSESALAAEATALELIEQAEAGRCVLLGAVRRHAVVGLGTLATDQASKRSYAMLLPHDAPPPGLREALLEAARRRGYQQVDFPMEALAAAAADTTQEPQPGDGTMPTEARPAEQPPAVPPDPPPSPAQ